MAKRLRLDKLLCERGLETSRERARARILAGEVYVAGQKVTKAGSQVLPDAEVEVRGDAIPYVSRGGLKLAQALDDFAFDVRGLRCIDVGASTGGFTDCLLQRGAAHVCALDVGYGQLAWTLRQDERVDVRERTNIRKVGPADFPQLFALAVIDCSFIGLDKVLPHVAPLLVEGGEVIALVKPQFEVGRGRVGKGGVVRDPELRRAAIDAVREASRRMGFDVVDGVDCQTHGPTGNVEYLLRLRQGSAPPVLSVSEHDEN